MSVSSMRDDEEFAKQRFDRYLQSKSLTTPNWTATPNRNDAPDFYLSLDRQCFAVEVTTLMERINVGGCSIPSEANDAAWRRVVRKVEQSTISQGILSGLYVVTLLPPAAECWQHHRDVERALLDYIRRTQADVSTTGELLWINGQRCCVVRKTPEKEGGIFVLTTTTQPNSAAKQAMCQLLQEALTAKTKIILPDPIILLLLDQNHLVDPVHYRDCLSNLVGLNHFHTLFIVSTWHSPEQDFVLYTCEASWQ